MQKNESKKYSTIVVAENSLNFELAKMKQKIQANSFLLSKKNLFIFTRECVAVN